MLAASVPVHPAFDRFMLGRHSLPQVIVIQNVEGAGAEEFATSWHRQFRAGTTLVSKTDHDEISHQFTQVRSLLEENPQDSVAILAQDVSSFEAWVGEFNGVSVTLEHLLLNEAEAQNFLSQVNPKNGSGRKSKIWNAVGGWYGSLYIAGLYGLRTAALRDALERSVAAAVTWPHNGDVLAYAGQLHAFDETTVNRFFVRFLPETIGTEELHAAGLIFEANGIFTMSQWTRDTLQRITQRALGDQSALIHANLSALLESKGTYVALRHAMNTGNWQGAFELSGEYWIDWYIDDIQKILSFFESIPPYLSSRFELPPVTVKLIKNVMVGDPEAWHRTTTPYSENQTVARFKKMVNQIEDPYSLKSLNFRLLLFTYLRGMGYFEQAAEAARGMVKDLRMASENTFINPKLISMMELHAALAFHKNHNVAEAISSYEAAYQVADRNGSDFLRTDAAGKLALIHSQQGHYEQARKYAQLSRKYSQNVGWGKSMVLRCTGIAEVFILVHELDLDNAERVLRDLDSGSKDANFPEVENYLGNVIDLLKGKSGEFSGHGPMEVQHQNHVGLSLDWEIRALIDLREGRPINSDVVPENEFGTRFRLITAVASLRRGDVDNAVLAVKGALEAPEYVGDWAGLATVLPEIIETWPKVDSSAVIKNLTRYGTESSLLEVMLISLIPGLENLSENLDLDDEQYDRIQNVRNVFVLNDQEVPVLTPREKIILKLLRSNYSRKEISEITLRSENTIKAQTRTLYKKLNAQNRQDALTHARRMGL